MSTPLTIYACTVPGCDYWRSEYSTGGHMADVGRGPLQRHVLKPVTVFREEDVRPLWEAARGHVDHGASLPVLNAFKAFPAPEEWRS